MLYVTYTAVHIHLHTSVSEFVSRSRSRVAADEYDPNGRGRVAAEDLDPDCMLTAADDEEFGPSEITRVAADKDRFAHKQHR